ncbi:lysophospholipase [Aureococcus anophagefferens]|nr:lysophospholipase [Aureococcus anophagefferens]
MAVFVGLRRKRERVEDKKVQSLKITRSPSLATTFRVKTLPQRSAPLSFPGDLEGPVVAPPLAAALRFFARTSLRAFLDGSTAEAAAAATWTRYGRGDVVCAARRRQRAGRRPGRRRAVRRRRRRRRPPRRDGVDGPPLRALPVGRAPPHASGRLRQHGGLSVSAASLRARGPGGLLRHCARGRPEVAALRARALARGAAAAVRAASIGDDDVLEALAPFGATYSHGCEVFAADEAPSAIFVVLDGDVVLEPRPADQRFAVLGRGTVCGGLEFVTRAAASGVAVVGPPPPRGSSVAAVAPSARPRHVLRPRPWPRSPRCGAGRATA